MKTGITLRAREFETDRDDTDALVRSAQSGSREDFARLVSRFYDMFYRIAWKWLGTRHDAEDAAQDACIRMAKSLGDYRFEAPFQHWCYRLALSAAQDTGRKRLRHYSREADIATWEEMLPSNENPERSLMQRRLLAEIARLPVGQRDAVFLVCVEGLNHKQAAKILRIAETTISWRIHTARKTLSRIGDAP